MKKTIFLASFVIFALFVQNACAQNEADTLLCKVWKVELQQSLAQMPPAKQLRYDSLSAKQKSQIAMDFGTRTFEFLQNHTLKIEWQKNGQAITRNGTWTWAANTEIPTIKVSIGASIETVLYQLLTIGTDTLVVYKPQQASDFFQKMIFSPNNL